MNMTMLNYIRSEDTQFQLRHWPGQQSKETQAKNSE